MSWRVTAVSCPHPFDAGFFLFFSELTIQRNSLFISIWAMPSSEWWVADSRTADGYSNLLNKLVGGQRLCLLMHSLMPQWAMPEEFRQKMAGQNPPTRSRYTSDRFDLSPSFCQPSAMKESKIDRQTNKQTVRQTERLQSSRNISIKLSGSKISRLNETP